jgi:hypothetical protein
LSYLYEFTGDYEKAEENKEKECSEFSVCKEDYIDVYLS